MNHQVFFDRFVNEFQEFLRNLLLDKKVHVMVKSMDFFFEPLKLNSSKGNPALLKKDYYDSAFLVNLPSFDMILNFFWGKKSIYSIFLAKIHKIKNVLTSVKINRINVFFVVEKLTNSYL